MPKRDLDLAKPMMNAAGTLGFAPDLSVAGILEGMGAFVTNPVSMRRRKAAGDPISLEFPGGFLLHTGLPNPGFPAVLRKYGRRWQDTRLPVIVHLMADRAEETRRMVQALESLDNIMAAELGFAPMLSPDILALVVEMSRAELPLIACLPAEQLLDVGPRLIELGAAALSLAAPRGALSREGVIVTGRLFGPALFPQALDAVYRAGRLGLPVIGGGGIYSKQDVDAMLSAGALAVQVDSSLWLPHQQKDPVD